MMKNWLTILIVALLIGCGGLSRTKIVKHPDAPMLIIEAKRGHVKVCVYNRGSNSLVEYGWVRVDELVGWTVDKYNWERFLNSQEGRERVLPEP